MAVGESVWIRGLGATLLVLELMLAAFPLTLLDGFGLMVLLQPNDHPDHMPTLLGTVLAAVGLLGFWWLAGAFLFNGFTLRGSPWIARIAAGLGVALCVASLMAALLSGRLTGWALAGLFGLPLLLPLGHMLLATWHRPAGDPVAP
ncbi:MAG: hypothetical protein GAK31_00843 [Stenotrophomonas maltophilia]|uniref:Transmembrane protein n=1 Tax=Stenotrophomonas maltophilia TaxID=40324 RepID=A0A7V8JNL0_STEMA|nr:MAG: hypothetical protein GAK31_00843 [Stenotrophomonas maltophilia]